MEDREMNRYDIVSLVVLNELHKGGGNKSNFGSDHKET